jgi:hypothetical protein
MNNMGRKSLQFELWQECNNLCKYCYLGHDNRLTPDNLKMDSLDRVYKAICESDYTKYNNVSFIGGEFFQGQLANPKVKELFMKLMEKVHELLLNRTIDSVWLTTTMTIGDNKDLYEVLDMFQDCIPDSNDGSTGLWICTSWDMEGRFHTPEHKSTWDFHMKNIHKLYPNIKFNTTIILMPSFTNAYLDGSFSLKEFAKEYNTTFFFKQGGIGEVNLSQLEEESGGDKVIAHIKAKEVSQAKIDFPFWQERKSFLKFLRKMAIEDAQDYDRLFNILYRADELYRNYNDDDRRMVENIRYKEGEGGTTESNMSVDNRVNTCGHILAYAGYRGNAKCMICDRNAIFEEVHG